MYPNPTTKCLEHKSVYEPAEDSFLLLDSLEQEQGFLLKRFSLPFVIELGTGSGIVSAFLQTYILKNALFFATDINSNACSTSLNVSKENGGTMYMDAIRTNLFDGLTPHFDILVFNPPYVPHDNPVAQYPADVDDEAWIDFALVGGEDGMEITWKLLNRLGRCLSPTGVAYILFCKSNKPEQVCKTMEGRGWKVKLVMEQRAGWERLSVWRFSR